jgi:hypothetical protein
MDDAIRIYTLVLLFLLPVIRHSTHFSLRVSMLADLCSQYVPNLNTQKRLQSKDSDRG